LRELSGRNPDEALEVATQMTLVGKPRARRDLRDPFSLRQKRFGYADAPLDLVAVGAEP
jgi:hypothetical protein